MRARSRTPEKLENPAKRARVRVRWRQLRRQQQQQQPDPVDIWDAYLNGDPEGPGHWEGYTWVADGDATVDPAFADLFQADWEG